MCLHSQMNVRWLASLAVAGVAMTVAWPSAASARQAATLQGVVVETENGEPIPDVAVYIAGKAFSTRTGRDGRFRLTGLEPGPHILVMRKIGYQPRGFRFELTENHLTTIDLGNLGIERQSLELEEIVVRERGGGGRLSGYYDRLDRSFGDFITRADIEKRNPLRSSEMFKTIPGVEVRCRASDCQVGLTRQARPLGQTVIGTPPVREDATELGGGIAQIARNQENVASDARDVVAGMAGRTSYFCPVQFFLDGVPYDGARGIDDIAPDMIEGIEIYKGPAVTPVRYAKYGAACGVVLIWTRRPTD